MLSKKSVTCPLPVLQLHNSSPFITVFLETQFWVGAFAHCFTTRSNPLQMRIRSFCCELQTKLSTAIFFISVSPSNIHWWRARVEKNQRGRVRRKKLLKKASWWNPLLLNHFLRFKSKSSIWLDSLTYFPPLFRQNIACYSSVYG